MISGISSTLSALNSFAKKVESSANNIANVNTDGFKRTRVVLNEVDPQGVAPRVERIDAPGPMVYEQTQNGEEMIEQSNVELTEEIPNVMLSQRFFEANLKVIQTTDDMLGSLLDLKG